MVEILLVVQQKDKGQQSRNSERNEDQNAKVDWKEMEAQRVEDFNLVQSEHMREQDILRLGCCGQSVECWY